MEKLHRLFSDNWAIQRHDFDNMVSLLMPSIIAGNITAAASQLDTVKTSVRATASPYMAKWYELDDLMLPVDSIAVITLSGALYSWESQWLIRQVEAVESNPNICGMVLVIDGPGGMVSHLDQGRGRCREMYQTHGYRSHGDHGLGPLLVGHRHRPHIHCHSTV